MYGGRTELVKRLLADTCELCGSKENIEVHHIRKLADVKNKGLLNAPTWAQVMQQALQYSADLAPAEHKSKLAANSKKRKHRNQNAELYPGKFDT